MIASLRGRVTRAAADEVVIDVGGVGYQVFCHLRTTAELRSGESVELHIHTAVSDDAIRLYGFRTAEELNFFRLLIGVERIGPKAALAILGRSELPVLVRAIASDDAALLATVPGVGRKTAERVCLELRDKISGFKLPGETGGEVAVRGVHDVVESAAAALIGLGFREAEVRAALAASDSADDDVNVRITDALRRLDRVGATP